MSKNTRGSEKILFSCEKNGKRSLAEFENVEEALQASGGMLLRRWEKFGQPGLMKMLNADVLQKVNLQVSKFQMR